MKDFDYTNHVNAKLLPKTCGKQKSGSRNSVISLIFVHIQLRMDSRLINICIMKD